MKTTTGIISEYNAETGTTQRETTITLYTFDELTEEARARVVADYAGERANDPYFSQWFADFQEHEIWECVRDLENTISWTGATWHYNRWYSCDFDCEFSYDDCYDPGELNRVNDNGICYSMDLCDAWNKHVRKLNGLCAQFEHVDYLCWDVYNEWDSNYYCDAPNNAHFYARADALRDHLIGAWYAELETACEDVRNTLEYLLRAEWEYYTGEEYAREECEDESTQGYECRQIDNAGRVYYSDCRRWYTVDGQFYEQSDVNHECVSIARMS